MKDYSAVPWVIFADTISVICEVSFMRNSSVPTSPRYGILASRVHKQEEKKKHDAYV